MDGGSSAPNALILADGTATWARARDSADAVICDLDADATGSGEALELDDVACVAGAYLIAIALSITEGLSVAGEPPGSTAPHLGGSPTAVGATDLHLGGLAPAPVDRHAVLSGSTAAPAASGRLAHGAGVRLAGSTAAPSANGRIEHGTEPGGGGGQITEVGATDLHLGVSGTEVGATDLHLGWAPPVLGDRQVVLTGRTAPSAHGHVARGTRARLAARTAAPQASGQIGYDTNLLSGVVGPTKSAWSPGTRRTLGAAAAWRSSALGLASPRGGRPGRQGRAPLALPSLPGVHPSDRCTPAARLGAQPCDRSVSPTRAGAMHRS
jgi:hypothetical protein